MNVGGQERSRLVTYNHTFPSVWQHWLIKKIWLLFLHTPQVLRNETGKGAALKEYNDKKEMEGACERKYLEKKKRAASLLDYIMNTEGKLGGNPLYDQAVLDKWT